MITEENEVATEAAETDAPNVELEALKSQTTQLISKMDSFIEASNKKQEVKDPGFTEEQLKDMAKTNPDLVIEYKVQKKAQELESKLYNSLRAEGSKKNWDQKTEEDFPLLKKDKAFYKEVQAQVQELTASGEFSKDSPTLVYRAAQIASAKYKSKDDGDSDSRYYTSGEAPRSGSHQKPNSGKIEKGTMQIAKLMNLEGKDSILKRVQEKINARNAREDRRRR